MKDIAGFTTAVAEYSAFVHPLFLPIPLISPGAFHGTVPAPPQGKKADFFYVSIFYGVYVTICIYMYM